MSHSANRKVSFCQVISGQPTRRLHSQLIISSLQIICHPVKPDDQQKCYPLSLLLSLLSSPWASNHLAASDHLINWASTDLQQIIFFLIYCVFKYNEECHTCVYEGISISYVTLDICCGVHWYGAIIWHLPHIHLHAFSWLSLGQFQRRTTLKLPGSEKQKIFQN